MKIERFEDIEGWKVGRVLASEIYAASRLPRFAQDFGLKDQIQRASGSIMHNIAEALMLEATPGSVLVLKYKANSTLPSTKRTSIRSSLKNSTR